MEIGRPQGWSQFITDTAGTPCRMLAHPFQGGGRKAEGGGLSQFSSDENGTVPLECGSSTQEGGGRKAEGGGLPQFSSDENGTVPLECGSSTQEGGVRKAVSLTDPSLLHLLAGAGPVTMAIGPEGGFTDAEAALALAAGWQAVDLGPRILRVETAAIVLTAWSRLTCPGR